jgi:hypothetical protein
MGESSRQIFDLKMQRQRGGDEDILIGRFNDPLTLESAQGPVRMFYVDEDIEEDAALSSEPRSAEFYSRRRKRRYRNKTALCIEEQGKRNRAGTGIKLQGSLLDTKTEGGVKSRYMLLQMTQTKDPRTGVDKTESKRICKSSYVFLCVLTGCYSYCNSRRASIFF